MADQQPQPEDINQEEQELHYLSFVRVLALGVVLWFLEQYNFVKEKSWLLRPIICGLENAARPIAVPVYTRFRHLPLRLLKFADRQVDEMLIMLAARLPPSVTVIALEVFAIIHFLVGEVQRFGVTGTATRILKEAYVKYQRQIEWAVVAAWHTLNYVPLFPLASHIVLPMAASWADQYNRALRGAAARGYRVSQYLPPVPLERIAQIFAEAERRQAAVRSTAPPTEAATPAESSAPAEAATPAEESSAPAESSSPAEAAAPAETAEPAEATAPAEAPAPAQATEPAQAAAPTEAAAPAETAEQTETAEPAKAAMVLE